MKHKTLLNLLVSLGLVLALGGSVTLARQPRLQDVVVQGPPSPQDDAGTGFTYQGRLMDNGTPVDGTCDFRFNLYDDEVWTPSLVAGPVDRGSVTVDGGYFSTGLDFGSNAFTGEGRQLQILVRCPTGSGSYTTLNGMVALKPVPYAHSLRPGAVISGDLAGAVGPNAALYVENAYSGPWASYGLQAKATNGTGVYGESLSSSGTGVEGRAASTGKGVRGETLSGYGVYGEATGGSGVIYGVYGKTNSPDGYAVYAEGRAYVDDELYVNGELSSDGNFRALSNAEVDGDVAVHGNLTWDAKTSYIAVSTAGFVPELLNDNGHVEYENEGYYLRNQSSSNEWYAAQVQLPHRATVTELSVGWGDGSDAGGTLYLKRRSMSVVGQGAETMAQVSSVGSLGLFQEGVWSDDTISYDMVENDNFTYFLEAYLPAASEDVRLYGVVIAYEISQPY